MASESYDILIIGAGAAALAAGRSLAAAGKRVAILGARARVGGRIHTHHVALAERSVPVELGAEFIHGLPGVSWQIIDEAKLATYELDGSQLCYAASQLNPCGEEQEDANIILEQLEPWLARQPGGTDVAFAEYLDRAQVDTVRGSRATAYVEGDRLFHVAAGYDAIPRFLEARFKEANGILLLGKPVPEIGWAAGSVVARGLDQAGAAFEVHAARAVVTLPLGVLQSNSVKFDPEPTDILMHARRLAVGSVHRMTLLFKHPFWRSRGARRCTDDYRVGGRPQERGTLRASTPIAPA